jgi:hypothetical protein
VVRVSGFNLLAQPYAAGFEGRTRKKAKPRAFFPCTKVARPFLEQNGVLFVGHSLGKDSRPFFQTACFLWAIRLVKTRVPFFTKGGLSWKRLASPFFVPFFLSDYVIMPTSLATSELSLETIGVHCEDHCDRGRSVARGRSWPVRGATAFRYVAGENDAHEVNRVGRAGSRREK